MDIAITTKCEAAASTFSSAIKRNEAIQAYSKASHIKSSGSKEYLKQATMNAISRWLSSDNVRVEFYSCKNRGEVRARIITDDKTDPGRDLSLYEFFSLVPVKI